MTARGAQADRRARRRAGHPRGRGGADDQRGHRARRAPRARGDGPPDRHRRRCPGRRRSTRRSTGSSTRATAGSRSTRSRSTRSSGSSTPRTSCRFLKAGRRPADPPRAPAGARLRARVDDDRRPAPRVPAPQGPPGDRARRVRRHRRPGHDRGPPRGDRGRDPGRVRRRGADGRPALDDDEARIDGRASVDELAEIWDDLDLDALLEDREEYDTVGGLVFHRIGGVPVPGDQIRVGA